MGRKRIGELLLEHGTISQAQLDTALATQSQTRQKLGVVLVQQQAISEGQLASALAALLGLPVVDLARANVDWSAVHLLRPRFCEAHGLFPFAIEGKGTPQRRLLVAVSDPLNDAAREEIGFTTGLTVSPVVGTLSQIREAIVRYYHKGSSDEARATAARPAMAAPRTTTAETTAPVVSGTLLEHAADPALSQLIDERRAATKKRGSQAAVAKDLEFLFGQEEGSEDAFEQLERRFWGLLRLMARKGLITREEFLKEVDETE